MDATDNLSGRRSHDRFQDVGVPDGFEKAEQQPEGPDPDAEHPALLVCCKFIE